MVDASLFLHRSRRALLGLFLLAAAPAALAQTPGVGIGTTAPDASAALDIVSSTKGALLPRVASAAALATPATGLLVFQTGAPAGFYYNAGTAAVPSWQQIATAAGAAITADNGLTKTGCSIGLGGTLTGPTTIGLGSYNLGFSSTGGNVGVGTLSPETRLTVASAQSTSSPTNEEHFLQLELRQLTGAKALALGLLPNGMGMIQAKERNVGYSPLLLNPIAGNVGIGTASPTQALEVAGTVYSSSGGFKFPDGTTQTTAAATNLTGAVTSTGNATAYNQVVPTTKGGAGAVSGLLKANGSGTVSAATAGTDYLTPTGSAAGLTNFPTLNQNTTGNAATVTTNANLTGAVTSTGNATAYNQVVPATKGGAGAVSGLLKANGAGVVSAAVAGTDYATATGSDSYIQNSPASQQSGSFNISGSGYVGGLLMAGSGATITGYASVTGAASVSGNVGIGTTNISGARLSVEGAGRGFPATGGTTQSTGQFARFSDNSSVVLDMGGNGGNGVWLQSTDATALATTNPLLLNPNGGNVGVGTTAPLNQLDIQSAAPRTGNHGSGLPLYVTGAMSDASSGVEFRHYNGTQGLGFGFNSIYAAGTNAIQNVNIMPKGGGNVGIGTITPVTQLANTSSNIVGTDGAGTGAQALSWLHASSGYAGAFFNAHSSIANADGLAVKIANPGAVALDISQGAAAGTAGTSLLRVNGSGNVGIGTNAPGARLSVLGTGGATTDLTVNGRISTGDAGGLGGVYVNQSGTQFVGQYNATTLGLFNAGWHLQVSNTGNVRLPGGGGGDTWFNNADGKTYLRGTTILADAGGFVGIGTTSPVAKLHVSGFRVGTMCADGTTYFSQANGAFLSYTSSGSGGGPKSLSGYFDGGELWVNNSIVAGNLCVSSDARIKHNLGLSDRAADLARLLQLRITNYRYIDQVNNTHDVVKKVIAQEVRAIYPEATNKGTAAIPNVYERATRVAFANGRLTVTTAKPHDLPAAGGRMRLYTKENQDLHVDCRVEDAHTFSFASSENYAELFVYGKYVDDFLSVDYDALAMLNISATQELARQVAALQQENAALKTRAAQADTDHASLLTLQAQMARLLGADGQARK